MSESPSHISLRAFTLVEVIVVMILLVVAAGLIAPRIGGQPAREARAEAEAVAGLLTTFADQLSTTGSIAPDTASTASIASATGGAGGVGAGGGAGGGDVAVLQFDAQTQTLSLARRLPGARKGEWSYEPLRLVPPVVMERTLITQVLIDGRVLSAAPGTDWRITVASVEARPAIGLTIGQRREGALGENATDLEPNAELWLIDLGSTDSSAAFRTRAPGSASLSTITSESVDLDLSGAGDTPW